MFGLLLAPAAAEPVQWSKDDGGDGRYYECVPDKLTWTKANTAAAERRHSGTHGRLVVITSKEQNAFLQKLLPGNGAKAWIGLSDAAEEGRFVWVDGSRPGYTNWNAGEPNNAGEEHFVEMYPDGRWNDKEDDPGEQEAPPSGYFVEYPAAHELAETPAAVPAPAA